MKWTPVDSSNLSAVAYNERQEQLHVRFNNGAEYRYEHVPHDVLQRILGAESKGKAFNALVRSQPAMYPYQRIA